MIGDVSERMHTNSGLEMQDNKIERQDLNTYMEKAQRTSKVIPYTA